MRKRALRVAPFNCNLAENVLAARSLGRCGLSRAKSRPHDLRAFVVLPEPFEHFGPETCGRDCGPNRIQRRERYDKLALIEQSFDVCDVHFAPAQSCSALFSQSFSW
jgi:hypothetical protein